MEWAQITEFLEAVNELRLHIQASRQTLLFREAFQTKDGPILCGQSHRVGYKCVLEWGYVSCLVVVSIPGP